MRCISKLLSVETDIYEIEGIGGVEVRQIRNLAHNGIFVVESFRANPVLVMALCMIVVVLEAYANGLDMLLSQLIKRHVDSNLTCPKGRSADRVN